MNYLIKVINYIKATFFWIGLVFTLVNVGLIGIASTFFGYLGIKSMDRFLVRIGKRIFFTWIAIISPNTTMVLSGDIEKFRNTQNAPAVVICNHQTYFDWLYIWLLAEHVHKGSDLCIIMKEAMKKVPLIGPYFEKAGFLLLARNWEQDKDNFDRYMFQFEKNSRNNWLIIFPEGTTRHKDTLEVSHQYAKKTGRPSFEYVLLPRSTGFAALVKHLSSSALGRKTHIYDLTLQFESYSGDYPKDYTFGGTVKDLGIPHFYGFSIRRHPIECHCHVSVYSIDDIVTSTESETFNQNIEQWLDNQFNIKENEMKGFIQNQQFSKEWMTNHEILHLNYSERASGFLLILFGLLLLYLSYIVAKYTSYTPFYLYKKFFY